MRLLDFHYSNLEFACGATLDKVQYCTYPAFHLSEVLSFITTSLSPSIFLPPPSLPHQTAFPSSLGHWTGLLSLLGPQRQLPPVLWLPCSRPQRIHVYTREASPGLRNQLRLRCEARGDRQRSKRSPDCESGQHTRQRVDSGQSKIIR